MVIHFAKRFFPLFCRCKTLWTSLLIIFLSSSAFGQHYSSIVLKNADKDTEPVEAKQVNEWIAGAENGDVGMIKEFSAAYLRPDDCGKLEYGHRCRAMAARRDAARKIFFDLIDSPLSDSEKDKYRNSVIGTFQLDYALIRLKEVRQRTPQGERPDPDDPACQDYLKYSALAAENGALCGPRYAQNAYQYGICTEKNREKSRYFAEKSDPCPMP